MIPGGIQLANDHIRNFHESMLQYDDAQLAKIQHAERRKESLLARHLLDQLCQGHLPSDLKTLGFGKDAFGKPILLGAPDVHISITHSTGHVIVGIADHPFGIDMELIQPEHAQELRIAFTEIEWTAIQHDPTEIFLQFTLKEAHSKLLGKGFLIEPSEIVLDKACYYEHQRIQLDGQYYAFSIATTKSYSEELYLHPAHWNNISAKD